MGGSGLPMLRKSSIPFRALRLHARQGERLYPTADERRDTTGR
jgi:hypothetical protein